MVLETKRQPVMSPTAIVAEYAAAKSRQDVEGALRVCREDFLLDTVPFGIRGRKVSSATFVGS